MCQQLEKSALMLDSECFNNVFAIGNKKDRIRICPQNKRFFDNWSKTSHKEDKIADRENVTQFFSVVPDLILKKITGTL